MTFFKDSNISNTCGRPGTDINVTCFFGRKKGERKRFDHADHVIKLVQYATTSHPGKTLRD